MVLAGRTLLGAMAALAVAGAALAGCASSGASAQQETPVATSSATHSTALPVADETDSAPEGVGMIGPVIVTPDQTHVTATVGRTIVLNVERPTKVVISTDRPDLLQLSQGHDDGSAIFNPGAVALGEGTATITLVEAGASRTIDVTLTPAAR